MTIKNVKPSCTMFYNTDLQKCVYTRSYIICTCNSVHICDHQCSFPFMYIVALVK